MGFLEASWGVLAVSWALWGPSCASWSDLSAIRRPLGLSWGPLGAPWARLGALFVPEKSRERMPGPPGVTPGDPRDLAIWGPGPLTIQSEGPRADDYKGSESTPTRASRAWWRILRRAHARVAF